MSFLYDNDLINKFIKISQQTPEIPPNTYTPSSGDAANNKNQLEIAKQLVKNLQTQISGGNVFTAERDDADLRPTHLVNLSNLLFFLNYNQIKYNGHSIALAKREIDIDKLGEDKKLYTNYPMTGETQYYVNKDGLEKYLRDLQSKGNPVLNAQISKLIDQVSSELKFQFSKDAPPADIKQPPGSNLLHTFKMEAPDGTTSNPGNASNPYGKPSQVNEMTLLHNALATLPLALDDINFTRINNFLNIYEQLINVAIDDQNIDAKVRAQAIQRKASVMEFIQDARNAMQAAKTVSKYPIFHLYGLAGAAKDNNGFSKIVYNTWLNNPSKPNYTMLISSLISVIKSASAVVDDMMMAYYQKLNRPNELQQQTVGGSIYRNNYDALASLLSGLS